MKNNLFNPALMRTYYNEFKLNFTKKEKILDWIKKLDNGGLTAERRNHPDFKEIFLQDILGYNRDEIFFEDPEKYGSGFSDFALYSGKRKFMVVELKGSDVNLDEKQRGRRDRASPVDQAFGYADNEEDDVKWVFVSNYDEFRLYNRFLRKRKYISFNVHELLDEEKFIFFMLAFSKKSHLDTDIAKNLIENTIVSDKELQDGFYNLYHETRLMIIKELEEINGFNKDDAINYTQIILNRYIFICFTEDMGLLPPQISTKTILNPIESQDMGESKIWGRINGLFNEINTGNTFQEIPPYNGKFFEKDLGINLSKDSNINLTIKIRDIIQDPEYFKDVKQKWEFEENENEIDQKIESNHYTINPIYRNLLIISSFDFSSKLDVDILGHIFENSIGDIEELKEGTSDLQKKEGIFYTPDYITDYICRNTIIPYLSKSGKVTTIRDLINEFYGSEIQKLDINVKKIKILDPACGSGAFLNKSSDILLEIHKAIHEVLYANNYTLDPYMDDIKERKKILLDNIYGVDLNEESVEITKLSLFLKVCRKDLKLPNLNNNIRCGNSIINNQNVAGKKSFDWNKEFSNICDDGGFDIVIGNPPWGAEFDEEEKKFIEESYNEIEYQINSYVVFLERSYHLLKDNGILGFITPPTWLYMHYFKKIRNFLVSNNTFNNAIYLKYFAFDNVTSESSIVCYKKTNSGNNNEILTKIAKNQDEFFDKEYSTVKQRVWSDNFLDGFLFGDEIEFLSKLNKNSKRLDFFANLTTGIKPYQENKGNPKQTREIVDSKIYSATAEISDEYDPYLVGGNITRYNITYPSDKWIKYGSWLAEPRVTLDFSALKLVIRRTSDKIFASIDKEGFYNLNSVHNLINKEDSNLDLLYILCLLNSSLIDCVYRYLVPDGGRVFSEVKIINLNKLPIYNATPIQQRPFIKLANEMIKLNDELYKEIKKFLDWFKYTFNIELSKKLKKYYQLELPEFLDEAKKKKVKVRIRSDRELLTDEFEKSLETIKPLQHKIRSLNNEIDRRVYDLYGLTEEEIKIIEENLK
jgi:hypothetical protein